ncbi:hypothetical protein HYU16_01355 [Candidatus Woesearchaeota archaeon]|nr:hypothetical protein [Candidatus Woesearchaeota archaeon]
MGANNGYSGLMCYGSGGLFTVILKPDAAEGIGQKLIAANWIDEEDWRGRQGIGGLVFATAEYTVDPLTTAAEGEVSQLAKRLNLRVLKYGMSASESVVAQAQINDRGDAALLLTALAKALLQK